MQLPTCINVRIRSTQDAHRIFYAVQEGILPMVTRRLDAEERLALRSGCVYVWEERGPQSEITGLGIERFTEGRRWTPSRVRDEFLFYYEREPTPRSHDWDQLVKQTYSVWVDTEKGKRKWHLTAYFTDRTVNDLHTIDDVPSVKGLVVPSGIYQSTRVVKSRQKSEDQPTSSKTSSRSHSLNTARTYAPFTHHNLYPMDASLLASDSLAMFDPYKGVAMNQYPPQTLVGPSSLHLAQGTSQQLSPPTYPRLPEPHVAPSQCGYVGIPSFANLHTIPGSMMSPSPPTTAMHSAAWGAAPDINSYPFQSVPRGIPSRYDCTEPYSLPPVSSIYDGHPLTPVGAVAHSPPEKGTLPANNSPYSTDQGPPQEPSYELYSQEANGGADGRRENIAPADRELALAPIHMLERRHPYRRDPLDDKTLRLLPG